MSHGGPAILAEGLEKSYGRTRALRGLNLAAEEGTVLVLLGPNGAGKTTAVRGFLLGQPVGSSGWQAFAWCTGILVVFVPLAISLYRRTTAR